MTVGSRALTLATNVILASALKVGLKPKHFTYVLFSLLKCNYNMLNFLKETVPVPKAKETTPT